MDLYFLDCPGTESESAGKSSACEGCPNQKICASGGLKEVDPGKCYVSYVCIYDWL